MIERMFAPSTPRLNLNDAMLTIAMIASAVSIFLVDLSTPHGYTIWLLYLPLCVGAAWFHRPREAIVGSFAATVLIPTAWLFIPTDEFGLATAVSRLLEIAAIWMSVTIVLVRQEAARKARDAFRVARDANHRLSGIIINNSEDAIVCIDNSHRITLFNHGAERMFGFTSTEAVGQDLSILLPGHVAGHHKTLVSGFATAAYLSRRMGERGTIMGRRRDGTEFPAEITISKLSTPDGMIFTAILRDISQRVNAERQASEQRQRLRLAMLAGRMGTFDYDRSLGLVRVDETTLRLLQLPLSQMELPYTVFFDRMHPDDRDQVFSTIENARRDGKEFRIEYRLPLDEGGMRWMAARGFGQLGDDGKPRRLMGITYDITDRVTAERSIRESEALNRSTLQSLPGHVAVLDGSGKILSANEPWIEFAHGRVDGDRNRYIGLDYFDLISRILEDTGSAASAVSGIKGVLAGERPSFNCEFSVPVGDGLQWFLMTAVPLHFDGKGGAVVSHLDITGRKKAEAQVADANRALEARVEERTSALRAEIQRREETQAALIRAQKLQAVGELAGGMAHDFNNLLTVITGHLELLGLRNLDSKSQDLLRRANAAAQMGARLAGRLLLIGRRQRLEPVCLNLSQVALGMIDMLRHTLGDQIGIRTQLSEALWPAVADLSEVENAILNLAINARDAMPEGGILEITTANHTIGEGNVAGENGLVAGDYVVLTVRDSGQGISPAVLTRVFEPYYSTKDGGRGTGLGLSTIYFFAKQSGGHVSIDSAQGKGTCVSLYLPRSHDPVVQVDRRQVSGRPQASGECILVVEDNPDVLDVTVKRLDMLGYTVLTADNGKAAMDVLERSPQVQLVFSDVVMPGGISGFDLARWTRLHRPGVRVLLTSGFTGAAGLDDPGAGEPEFPLLKKPYALPELARAVREALS
jgi:PAS domain S-box-containing protein